MRVFWLLHQQSQNYDEFVKYAPCLVNAFSKFV